MRPLEVVVFDEFRVELESGMLEVVCEEPPFDLAKRRGLTDAAEDMLDPFPSQYASALRIRGNARTPQITGGGLSSMARLLIDPNPSVAERPRNQAQ